MASAPVSVSAVASGRRRLLTIVMMVLSAAILVAGTAGITFVIMHDTRQDITLAEISATDRSPFPVPIAYRGMHDATERLCSGLVGCIEGYEADHVSYYRFARRYDAAAFARTARDAFQSDWIVIQFTDDVLSEAQRTEIRQNFDGFAVSDDRLPLIGVTTDSRRAALGPPAVARAANELSAMQRRPLPESGRRVPSTAELPRPNPHVELAVTKTSAVVNANC